MTQIDVNSLLMQMRRLGAQAELPSSSPIATPSVGQGSFGSLLKQSLEDVNAAQVNAGKQSEAFERGDPGIDLAQVMITGQKASLGFTAVNEVRNKLVDAYKEIMQMSI
jgi:flagellar hook-basal body complex protein FliE